MRKNVLFLVMAGSLLCTMSLCMSGCSKKSEEMAMGVFNRYVYLRIINESAFSDNAIMLHFDPENSHSGDYHYYKVNKTLANNNDNNNWGDNDGNWLSMTKNEWIDLGRVKNCLREKNLPNFGFLGSTTFVWHQDIIIGIGRDDQEKFQIKGTSAANNANEINVWLNRWSNSNKRIKLECTRVEVGNNYYNSWSVFVDITVKNN